CAALPRLCDVLHSLQKLPDVSRVADRERSRCETSLSAGDPAGGRDCCVLLIQPSRPNPDRQAAGESYKRGFISRVITNVDCKRVLGKLGEQSRCCRSFALQLTRQHFPDFLSREQTQLGSETLDYPADDRPPTPHTVGGCSAIVYGEDRALFFNPDFR